MRLWIAEKPIVAQAIADVLPKPHIENDGFIACGNNEIVTWCKGHLYELAEPEEYDGRLKTWRIEDLPFVPPENGWKYTVRDANKKQLQIINTLIDTAVEIVHCGDYDREGQLIVDEVLIHANHDPAKAKRLLLQALDAEGVRERIADLQPNADYMKLGVAARARAWVDYILGINMSRLYTILGRSVGYNKTFSIGRVKTPTLKLVVDRDRAIANFVPITHYRIRAMVKHATKGEMIMEWKPNDNAPGVDDQGRVIDKAYAEQIAALVQGKDGIVTDYSTKEEAQGPPLPHNLTSLTALANSRLGLTASELLKIAQRLYEHFKMISYPRTDSRYLPENQRAAAGTVLQHVAKNAPDLAPFIEHADPDRVTAAWDSSKMGAHHGIIPTANSPANVHELTPQEQAVYKLICMNYVAQFYPDATSLRTTISVKIGTEIFSESVSEKIDLGFQVIFRDPKKVDKPPMRLPELPVGDRVICERAQVGDLVTKRPDHFTDGTLVTAMTTIDKFVEEEEIKRTLADSDGIGTSATRSTIIDELVTYGMLRRNEKRQLVATDAGCELIDIIHPQLKSPGFTARSEQILAKIEAQKITPWGFVVKYVDVIKGLMDYAVANPPKGVLGRHKPQRVKPKLLNKPGDPSSSEQTATLAYKRRAKPQLLPKPTDA